MGRRRFRRLSAGRWVLSVGMMISLTRVLSLIIRWTVGLDWTAVWFGVVRPPHLLKRHLSRRSLRRGWLRSWYVPVAVHFCDRTTAETWYEQASLGPGEVRLMAHSTGGRSAGRDAQGWGFGIEMGWDGMG